MKKRAPRNRTLACTGAELTSLSLDLMRPEDTVHKARLCKRSTTMVNCRNASGWSPGGRSTGAPDRHYGVWQGLAIPCAPHFDPNLPAGFRVRLYL